MLAWGGRIVHMPERIAHANPIGMHSAHRGIVNAAW
jgi:hypothetical protein